MRTLASFIFTSLDGFYEGPNGELDWPVVDDEFRDIAVRQLDEATFSASAARPMSTWPLTGPPSRPRRTTQPSPRA